MSRPGAGCERSRDADRLWIPVTRSEVPPATAKQRDQEENQENHETNLGDRGGGAGDNAETEDARNKGDDQEYDCVA